MFIVVYDVLTTYRWCFEIFFLYIFLLILFYFLLKSTEAIVEVTHFHCNNGCSFSGLVAVQSIGGTRAVCEAP